MINNRHAGYGYMIFTAMLESHTEPRYYYKVSNDVIETESNLLYENETEAETAAENYIDQLNGRLNYRELTN